MTNIDKDNQEKSDTPSTLKLLVQFKCHVLGSQNMEGNKKKRKGHFKVNFSFLMIVRHPTGTEGIS